MLVIDTPDRKHVVQPRPAAANAKPTPRNSSNVHPSQPRHASTADTRPHPSSRTTPLPPAHAAATENAARSMQHHSVASPQRPSLRPPTDARLSDTAGQTISDAASSRGYGSRYYTFRAQVPLRPRQKVGYTPGRGYYAYYPSPRSVAREPLPGRGRPSQGYVSPSEARTLSDSPRATSRHRTRAEREMLVLPRTAPASLVLGIVSGRSHPKRTEVLHIGGIGEVIVSQQASVTVSAAVRRGRLSVAYSAGPNSSISATGGGISVDVPGNLSHRARTWKVDVATVTSLLLRHQASVTLPEGEPFDVNLSAHGRKVRTPIRSVTYEAKLTTEDGYPALELKTSAETDDVKLGPAGPISAEFSITTTFTIKNKLNPTVSDIEEILAIAAAVLIARGLTPSRPVVDPALDR